MNPRRFVIQASALIVAATALMATLGWGLVRLSTLREDSLRYAQGVLVRRHDAEGLGVAVIEKAHLDILAGAASRLVARADVPLELKEAPLRNIETLYGASRMRIAQATAPLVEEGKLEAETYWETRTLRVALNATRDGSLDQAALQRALLANGEVQQVLAVARARVANEAGEDGVLAVAERVRHILERDRK